MNKLIAYYQINKTKYYISLLNNNKIVFLKSYKNHNFSINLNNKELKIINKVYNSLKPNLNKSIYLKELNINNNNYKLYLDKSNHNHFWLPTNNIYNEIDNLYLNYKYNHQEAIIYSNSNKLDQSRLSKFYNKLINIGSKIIPIFISATISLSILNSSTIIKQENIDYPETSITETIEYNEETLDSIISEIEEETEQQIEYNYEEIRQAIESNQNLSPEEKDLLYKLKFIFDDNHQFMNLDLVINNIKKLKIEYNANIGGGTACYNIIENKIYVESTDFDSTKKSHLIHEFLHCLQGEPHDFIGELSTEFFTKETMVRLYKENLVEKEFFLPTYAKKEYQNGKLKLETEEEWLNYLYKNNRFSSGYEGYSNLYTLLAEIITPDTLRHYQFNPQSYEKLIEELIIIDEQYNKEENKNFKVLRAYQLIESINDLRVYSYELNGYTYLKDTNDFCNKLNYYYKIKQGLNLNEEPIASLYLEYAGRLEYDFENKIMDYMKEKHNVNDVNTIITKTYLSNSQEKTLLTHYQSNKQIAFIEINQDIEENYIEYLHLTTEHIRGYTK